MRTWKSSLLVADLLAFFVLSIIRGRGKLRVRLVPFIVLLAPGMADTQCLAEGPRLQMLPACAPTLLLSLAWLSQRAARKGNLNGRIRPHPDAGAKTIGLGALNQAIAAARPLMVPVFRFAHPSGPHAIGTLTCRRVDASHAEAFTADPKERRQLMVHVWYPAQADPSARRAAYMAGAGIVKAAFARLQGMPAFLCGHFKYVTGRAEFHAYRRDAGEQRHAACRQQHPVPRAGCGLHAGSAWCTEPGGPEWHPHGQSRPACGSRAYGSRGTPTTCDWSGGEPAAGRR